MRENSTLKWMRTGGYPYDVGNLQMVVSINGGTLHPRLGWSKSSIDGIDLCQQVGDSMGFFGAFRRHCSPQQLDGLFSNGQCNLWMMVSTRWCPSSFARVQLGGYMFVQFHESWFFLVIYLWFMG